MSWKDTSSYSRDEPHEARKPRTLEYRTPHLRIVVHRHVHYPPDAWLLSCHNLALDLVELGNKDLEKAKAEALDFIRAYLELSLKELS